MIPRRGFQRRRIPFRVAPRPAAINCSQLDFRFFAGKHLSGGEETRRELEDMLRRLLFTRARNRNPGHYLALRTFSVFGYWNKLREVQLPTLVFFGPVLKFNQPVVLKSITFCVHVEDLFVQSNLKSVMGGIPSQNTSRGSPYFFAVSKLKLVNFDVSYIIWVLLKMFALNM